MNWRGASHVHTAIKTRVNQELDMAALLVPVNLLVGIVLEPSQRWDVDAGWEGLALCRN